MHAAKKGRCPKCRSIVEIPASSISEELSAVPASDARGAAPPPPSTPTEEEDEFHLVDLQTSSASETDSYPAIREEAGEEDDPAATAARDGPAVPHALPANRLSHKEVVTAIVFVVILLLIVGAVLLGLLLN